ncbi:MAG TPA: DNA double-strand break repair nuclease NurA [Anaerolineae bacterium]
MTLELGKVASQVAAMGANAAQRTSARAKVVPTVLGVLTRYRADHQVREMVESAIRQGWGGAVPVTEPLDAAIDPIALPKRLTIVATDGSQIYPDRHGIALYYVINVGSIVLRLGSGEAPGIDATPAVCFDEEQLYGDDDYPVSGQVINARRTVVEMTRLAQLAAEEVKSAPTVALADGNIALRVKQEGIPAAERDRLETEYIRQLNTLRAAEIATGGFISRPGATSVVRLAELAEQCPPDRVAEFVKNNKGRPYEGITDTPLFDALLKPGQRSAVFKLATQWARPYEATGHAIHFFYLNIGTDLRSTVARIEVPEWVASDPERLGLLHAAIVDQCRVTDNAYPYVLMRADELAVITSAEKANFEQMVGVELLRHGIQARPSEKAATKSIARYGKKR